MLAVEVPLTPLTPFKGSPSRRADGGPLRTFRSGSVMRLSADAERDTSVWTSRGGPIKKLDPALFLLPGTQGHRGSSESPVAVATAFWSNRGPTS